MHVFQLFFNLIINNSYGPLIHALPLSLADMTGGFDPNREAAEEELHERTSLAEGESDEPLKNTIYAREGSVTTTDSPPNGKGRASTSSTPPPPSPAVSRSAEAEMDVEAARDPAPKSTEGPEEEGEEGAEEDHAEEDPRTAPPPAIKPVDEDAGPREFYHPASVEAQRVVWLPQDVLGIAEEEARAIREAGILVSLEHAVMDDKGHVDVSGAPPGNEVRMLGGLL